MNWFGNDKDGLSIQDFIGLGAFIMWAMVSGMYLRQLSTITSIQVDFYGAFMILPVTVVGGVYGVRALGGAIENWQNRRQLNSYLGDDTYANNRNEPPV